MMSRLSLFLVCGMLAVSGTLVDAKDKGNKGNSNPKGLRDKGKFKVDFKSNEKSKTLLKLNVAETVATLDEVGSKSKNDEIGGYTVSVKLRDNTWSETANEKGKIKIDGFQFKLVANGRVAHIIIKSADLVTVFGISSDAEDTKNGTVTIPVTITVSTSAEDGTTKETVLYNGEVTFKYKSKQGKKASGKI